MVAGHAPRVSRGLYELPTKEHALYRFYDRTDVLLYVGITMDLPKRFKQHRQAKPWWLAVTRVDVDHFESRRAALAAEKAAIRDESPLYNDQHNEFVHATEATPEVAQPEPAVPVGEIFRFLRNGEMNGYLDRAREYYDDTDPTAILANAGRIVVDDLTSERARLIYAAQRLVRTWADCISLREKVEERAREFDFHHTEGELLANVLDAISKRRERNWLDNLSDGERDEWLACVAVLHGLSVEEVQDDTATYLVRAAYDYYADYRDFQWTPEVMCRGAGQHGARCPNLASQRIYIADCPRQECDQGKCAGHVDLCAGHLEKVLDGRMRRHDGTRVIIDRHEIVPPPLRTDEEAPF